MARSRRGVVRGSVVRILTGFPDPPAAAAETTDALAAASELATCVGRGWSKSILGRSARRTVLEVFPDPLLKFWSIPAPSSGVKDLDELDVTVEPKTKVERVYREQGARLWRAVFLVSGDREVASDAVSEAFAQALARGTDLKSIEDWVWRTAFRVAMGLLQDKSKMTQLVEEPTYEMSGAADDVVRALRSLSPSQRAVIVLHYYADCPIREIATRTGSTPAAVGVHLHRARKRLRSLLEADNG